MLLALSTGRFYLPMKPIVCVNLHSRRFSTTKNESRRPMTEAIKNNKIYELYMASIVDFAKTVVIKLDELADGLNYLVMQKSTVTSVDPSDKSSWKYYQNISGSYHFTDEPMMITSLDTGARVRFDKNTLATHPVTKQAYRYGSYYYDELLGRYPDSELLIHGILNPVDLQEAIDAKNGTILTYDARYVEEWETELIANLQTWVYNFVQRWFNPQYARTDNLYVASFFAQLSLNIVPVVWNLRTRACKTNQAHSFHIAQYLRSHGYLDTYLPEMTREQVLGLYRNIRRYRKHAGSQENFESLVDLLLTKRNMALFELEFRQDSGSILYENPKDVGAITPEPVFVRLPANSTAKLFPQTNSSLDDAFTLINSQAAGNPEFHQNQRDAIRSKMRTTKDGKMPTKVFEASLDTNSDTYIQAPDEIVFNEWVHTVAMGRYVSTLELYPPGETVPILINQEQAVALWAYCLLKSQEPVDGEGDFEMPERVPMLGVSYVRRSTQPTLLELQQIVDTRLLTPQDIQLLIDNAPPEPPGMLDIQDFEAYCSSVYVNGQRQYRLYSFKSHPVARAMGQMVAESMFENKLVALPSLTEQTSPYRGVLFSQFLEQIGFDGATYTQADWFEFAKTIFEQATGVNINISSDPARVQAAMVAMLRQLSSYSIQVAYTPATSYSIPANRPDVRVSDFTASVTNGMNVGILNLTTDVDFQEVFNEETLGSNQTTVDTTVSFVPTFTVDLPVNRLATASLSMEDSRGIIVRTGLDASITFEPI